MSPARRVPTLTRATVDRDAATRDDPAALAAAWDRAQVLVVDDSSALVDEAGEHPRLLLMDSADAPKGERLYLGRDELCAYFAVAAPLGRRPGARALGLREVGALLSDRDAGLLVHAVGLVAWHRTHPRCARCGAPTEAVRGGAVRRCAADGSDHFPRTDPAMIVLVHDGADHCVLGRQASWPEGRFSTLAGFVEPGESAEQAVVREIGEETGLLADDVRYVASQPWPFPSSLMLGFTARADGAAVPVPRDGELAEARWFSRDEIAGARTWGAGSGDLQLPSAVSISHLLITGWLDGSL